MTSTRSVPREGTPSCASQGDFGAPRVGSGVPLRASPTSPASSADSQVHDSDASSEKEHHIEDDPMVIYNEFKNRTSDDPSPPDTFPATITAVGIVIVCAGLTTLTSRIILPTDPVAGKFVKLKVTLALVVNV